MRLVILRFCLLVLLLLYTLRMCKTLVCCHAVCVRWDGDQDACGQEEDADDKENEVEGYEGSCEEMVLMFV